MSYMCALVSLNWAKFPQSWKVVLLSKLLDTSQHGCVDVFSICSSLMSELLSLGHITIVSLNIRQLSCLSSAQVIPISWHLLPPFPCLIVSVVLYCRQGFMCPCFFWVISRFPELLCRYMFLHGLVTTTQCQIFVLAKSAYNSFDHNQPAGWR
jgi:hypothetical protein